MEDNMELLEKIPIIEFYEIMVLYPDIKIYEKVLKKEERKFKNEIINEDNFSIIIEHIPSSLWTILIYEDYTIKNYSKEDLITEFESNIKELYIRAKNVKKNKFGKKEF